MEPSIAKRNYFYITYSLLKQYTNKEDHLSAEEICAKIFEVYGVEPNRKTIYTIIDDLKEFGVDVKVEKGKNNPGFYLNSHELTLSQATLLADGISSVSFPQEEKDKFYELLSQLSGYEVEVFDPAYYRNDNNSAHYDRSVRNKVEIITNAIKDGKKVTIYEMQNFCDFLLEEPSERTKLYFLKPEHKARLDVNPYKIVRNVKDELFLLFSVVINSEKLAGAISLSSDITGCDSERDNINPEKLFYNLNLKYFIDALDFRANSIQLHSSYYVVDKAKFTNEMYYYFKDNIESESGPGRINNQDVYSFKYKPYKEERLINFFLDNVDIIRLYDGNLKERIEKMVSNYQKAYKK